MGNPNPSPATRFGPGNRANPGGRPKRKPLSDELTKLLKQKAQGSQYTHAHMVAWKMIQMAEAGKVEAARLVWEYVEGKATQRVEFDLEEAAERLAQEYGVEKGRLVDLSKRLAARVG